MLLQQSKMSARVAISGLTDQRDKLKVVRKQIIRVRAEYEELLEDGKQVLIDCRYRHANLLLQRATGTRQYRTDTKYR